MVAASWWVVVGGTGRFSAERGGTVGTSSDVVVVAVIGTRRIGRRGGTAGNTSHTAEMSHGCESKPGGSADFVEI
jgi:hypothetical protein